MLRLSNHNIEVLIIDDRQAGSCEDGCGMDWTSAENVTLAGRQIKAAFGDGVQLKRLNLSEAAAGLIDLELQQGITNGSLSLPLLIIDGKMRVSGPFDIRILLDAVEAVIESKL